MRVTYLSMEFPPKVYGGAGAHVTGLANALKEKLSVEVRCIGEPGREEENGMMVQRFKVPDMENRALASLLLDTRMIEKDMETDIIHAQTWYTAVAGLWGKHLHGKKMVATVHTLEPLRPWKKDQLGLGYSLSNWMERKGLEGADRLIAVSSSMKDDLVANYSVDPNIIDVIPNGVDIESYRKVEENDVLERFKINGPYCLFVGRISKQKGIIDLLTAWKDITGCKLVLVTGRADTPIELRTVRKKVRENRDVIWLNQYVEQEALCQLYSHASMVICPSRYEPFGTVTLEAMACSTPVIATSVGGTPEILVDGETGIMYKAGNREALAGAVKKLLTDPELAKRMGEAGRKRVEELFNWEHVAQLTMDTYKKTMEE